MRTTMPIAALLLAAALLAGCGSNDDTDSAPASATPSNTWPGGMSPEPDATTEEPEPIPTALALGEAWAWESTGDDGDATGETTVLGYRQPITSIATAEEEVAQKGYVWGALELKVCAETGSILVSSFDWTLAYEDGARVEPSSSTWDDFPKPEFPTETEVRAGDCVRGKIVYPVPGDQRPERALYAPPGIDQPVEWTVPTK